MASDQDLERLSDLVHLCASTLRIIAGARFVDAFESGAADRAADLASDLDKIADDLKYIERKSALQQR